MTNDPIFNKIANALLVDYSSVYYVNAVTNEYQWYSTDSEFHSLNLQPRGEDFFSDLVRDADLVIYEPDKHLFTEGMQKDNLLSQMKKGTMQNIEYRLMIDGKPVYHSLRLIRGLSDDDDYFILGVLNVDKQVRAKQEAEKTEAERELMNQIAGSLAAHYETLYYIDIETDKFFEFSSSNMYKSLGIPTTGDDFFTESRKNIRRIVHPDDREHVIKQYYKENMLESLANKTSITMVYRLIFDGEPRYYRSSQIWASDHKHVIIGVENIDKEKKIEEQLKETQKKTVTIEQIAESLASHYDVIYYVDSISGNYSEFNTNSLYGNFQIHEEGKTFFEDAKRNIGKIIHPEDRERMWKILEKDSIITTLDERKQFSTDYRLVVEGKTQYTRFTVMWSSDKVHFIIGVENINEEVKKEKAQVKALNQANELARRDELTGVKNKKAFHELEETVQNNIDSGLNYFPFALVVCDINNLKLVNDTQGHKAGDEYIRASCRLICNTFTHSQVFRIGGDEFVAFLGSGDFFDREVLMERLHQQVQDNLLNGEGAVVAAGIAVYERGKDMRFSDIFERADNLMYEDKTRLKELSRAGGTTPDGHKIDAKIPDTRKELLKSLFNAFAIVAEGTYVYLCDLKYDYSIWSKTAVETFGLPSEYMYRAGDIWEEHIHPDDREIYRIGINDIFTGKSSGHDMQYRAVNTKGEYTVCTCRGVVLRDENGVPDYFGGVIRNHGIIGHIDELTGLRNQYGLFEDLQSDLLNNNSIRLCMIGIRKFSEINEVYGYHFGNTVLQHFGRFLFEHIGNEGCVYRLDGTKFVVMSSTQSLQEQKDRYNDLKSYFREKFSLNDKRLVLELCSGIISVDDFNIDSQTVFSCLNYAYSESKFKTNGEIVEFTNGQSKDNRKRIEQLHAIRASITQDFKGFYLLYQPVVDAHTQQLVGGEALLRWKNDEYGVVPPDNFIPVLETDPLFCSLGEWILKTALIAAKKIRETNKEFVMNVNLSYSQLERTDFVDMVLRTLREVGYPAENLCLEITERCRLLNMEMLNNKVVNLRGGGVKIALDDFGTGFSSVGLVKNLTFDVIKIDRSFVRKIEEDETERKLIENFMNLGSIFGATICVEGIETANMRDIIRGYNVRYMQGYFFAKPLPFDEFITWEHKE